jgi:hypothetical protein
MGCRNMTGEHWTVNSDVSLENLIKHLRELYADKKYIQVKWTIGKAITNPQRNSVYLYCDLLAKELNGQGLDMVKTLSDVEIPWSKESAKKHIWAKVQNAKFGNVSINDLKTSEVSQIYDVINRHLSNTFGVYVPFPTAKRTDAD